MTILPSLGRALSKQLVTRANQSHLSSNFILRVASNQSSLFSRDPSLCSISRDSKQVWSRRTYATAAGGSSTAPKRASKPRSKPAAKKSAPKSKTPSKRKAAKKPVKKPASKRKAAPRRKQLTEVQIARAAKRKENKAKKDAVSKLKTLKETSLLGKEPKALPRTAWQVVSVEQTKGSRGPVTESFKSASQKYRSLSPAELEHYNHIANQNREANQAAYVKWVESHTPAQILAANHARQQLATQARKATNSKRHGFHYIKDDRLVTRPRNAYSYFLQERHSTGDYKGMTVVEAAKLIAREWKGLSDAQKKVSNSYDAVTSTTAKSGPAAIYRPFCG